MVCVVEAIDVSETMLNSYFVLALVVKLFHQSIATAGASGGGMDAVTKFSSEDAVE